MNRQRHFGSGYSYFGEDYDDIPVGAKGMDIKAFGDGDGKYALWDASANLWTIKGASKFHNRPTTDAFALEVKSEFTDTDAGHNCVMVTADWKANGAVGGANTALQGTSRLAATYTATGGAIIGTYSQVCNLGTLNGSGIMVAGLYGLIEDGGVYTAVSHVASAWLDSHLDQTVTAGESELQYMTNNGETTLGQAFFIYAGNKITNLFNINTASGMLSADNAGAVAAQTGYRTIKIVLEGETYYLVASKAVT
jgi:hypothetical protein